MTDLRDEIEKLLIAYKEGLVTPGDARSVAGAIILKVARATLSDAKEQAA